MNLEKKIINVLFFFFTISSFSQIDISFVDYLEKNNFQTEHYTYLKDFSENSTDSIDYLKAKYFLKYYNDSLFFEHYNKSKNIFLLDTTAVLKANIFFLNENNNYTKQRWFNAIQLENQSFLSHQVQQVYIASMNPKTVQPNYLPVALQKDFLKFKKVDAKKPLVGGLLSLAVPGLGKLYVGKKRSFATTFFTHLIMGVQSYESIKNYGVKNAFSVFSLSFLSVFYVANVYSGYYNVKQTKNEVRKQFLINASNYYNYNF